MKNLRRKTGFSDSARPDVPLVVHIIYSLGTGGLENGLVNIINRCPPERYRHAIVCLTTAERFATRLSVAGVEVVELHKKAGHDPAMYWRLWKTLRQLRPAIVHTRNLAALETQILGLFLPGVRRVHGEHGRDVNDLDGSNSRYRWLRRVLCPLINRFIAVSDDLAGWLVNTVGIPSERVVQIYNGVDHDRFISRFTEDDDRNDPDRQASGNLPQGCPGGVFRSGGTIIGTVGRLAAVKDQQLIIRALSRIFEEQPAQRQRLGCIIVGEGPEHAALKRCITEHGLAENVWLAGESDDIPLFLSCLDVFVLPSLGEGISNTVLEAMATGLPVIATAVGGNPELIEEGVTGNLVPVGDEFALARAIAALVDDEPNRERMGRAAMARVRADFNWGRTVESYLQVYDGLLFRPRPAEHSGQS